MNQRYLKIALWTLLVGCVAGAGPVIWFGNNSKDLSVSGILSKSFGIQNSGFVSSIGTATLTANRTFNFPDSAGVSGQGLITDGAGNFTFASTLVNPMDSAGDMIYGGALGAATKLDSGTLGQWLVSGGAAAPTWTNTTTTGKTVDGSANEVQLTVQGNGTQTANTLVVEQSDGDDVATIADSGTAYFGPAQDRVKVLGTKTNGGAALLGAPGDAGNTQVVAITASSSTDFTVTSNVFSDSGGAALCFVTHTNANESALFWKGLTGNEIQIVWQSASRFCTVACTGVADIDIISQNNTTVRFTAGSSGTNTAALFLTCMVNGL